MRSTCEIAIVGGGLSGLTAASVLGNAGRKFTLFEASDRLGGRIHSVQDAHSTLLDLGPTWVWPPYQPSVTNWMNRLGLKTFAQYETGPAVLDLQSEPAPRHQHLPGQHGMVRIVNGPQAFIDALSNTVPQNQITYDHELTQISFIDGHFVLKFGDSDAKTVTAGNVIICAPLRRMVEQVTWNGLLNDEAQAVMKAAPTWMATQTKVSVLYAHPFWRQRGLSGRVASQLGPLTEIHDHCSHDETHSALFGFLGWPGQAQGSDQLKQSIVQQLVRCFGEDAAKPERIEIQDWSTHPYICSNIDRQMPAEHPQVLPALVREGRCNGRLVFGVAETADQHPGLIDGALQSGERAALQVLSNIG